MIMMAHGCSWPCRSSQARQTSGTHRANANVAGNSKNKTPSRTGEAILRQRVEFNWRI
jgi:hypothetical protein